MSLAESKLSLRVKSATWRGVPLDSPGGLLVELLVERACVWDAAGLATSAGPCGRTGADHWALGGSVAHPECVAQPVAGGEPRPRAAKWRAVASRGTTGAAL